MSNKLTNDLIMITGSTGFLGKFLCNYLKSKNLKVVGVSRNFFGNEKINLDFQNNIDWKRHLTNIKCIIHTAAKVHQLNLKKIQLNKQYDQINYEGTVSLARQAASSGVSRFIYISSAKVCGDKTKLGQPMKESDVPVLDDPYAISKFRTEKELLEISAKTKMEIVIIRPPLVYGPGVKANFLSMMKWLNKGVPLPFANINNLRSLISLENLANFIFVCIDHIKAKNQIFFISDDQDISTSLLLEKILYNLKRNITLFSFNKNLAFYCFLIFGKKNIYDRLFNSLQVDITKAKTLTGWKPIITLDQGLYETTKDFLGN
tara:strand:- start:3507 stop:4460 length:954 start_codon:yes stop_codon:yes gene_type:complete